MPTKMLLKKLKLSAPVKSEPSAPVTPTSTKSRKTSEDESEDIIHDFVLQEFQVHREATIRRHEREKWTGKVDSKLVSNRTINESMRSPNRDREKKGRCPTCDHKRGFGIVEEDDMANELMGVVMHVDDLLDEAHEALRKVKAQFRAAVPMGGGKVGEKSWKIME